MLGRIALDEGGEEVRMTRRNWEVSKTGYERICWEAFAEPGNLREDPRESKKGKDLEEGPYTGGRYWGGEPKN